VPPSWHNFGALGPIASAFIVTAVVDGRLGIKELLSRMVRRCVERRWLLLALLSPLALFVISIVILMVLGSPLRGIVTLGPEQLASFAWIVGVFYGVGEEPGWRGLRSSEAPEGPQCSVGNAHLGGVLVSLAHFALLCLRSVSLGLSSPSRIRGLENYRSFFNKLGQGNCKAL
jgi:hypothetical protein